MNAAEQQQTSFDTLVKGSAKRFQINEFVLRRAVDAKLTHYGHAQGTPDMRKVMVLELIDEELSQKKTNNEDLEEHLNIVISNARRCFLD